MPFSTSSIRTSLPNSLGLCALPLRMTSVCASNKLNTFSSTWQLPPHTRCLVWVITFSTKGRKLPELADLRFHPPPFAHHLQSFLPPSLQHRAGLSHHAPTQSQQLLVTVPHALLVGLGQALGGAADLQQTMFPRAPVIHHFHGSPLTLAGDALQAAAEHADAVAQKRAVGGIVNVAFHDSRVGAKFAALGDALLAGQADHPLMNLFGDRRTQQGEAAAEGAEIGGSLGIEVGEAAVHQVAAQFPFQIAEAPALQVLHDTAAQQPIGRQSGSPRTL